MSLRIPAHAQAGWPIGVFDSGVGGLSILRALRAELPYEDFVYFADSGHAPYGEKDHSHVIARAMAITAQLRAEHGIKALVIACNTATAAAVHLLRADHPDLPIVGVEPALKPAIAQSRTRRIGVMATRGTLGSAKFALLLASLSGQAEFVLQPCDGLADAVEHQESSKIVALCDHFTMAMGRFGLNSDKMDTLVLGCTHYAFANDALRSLLGPEVRFIDTGEPVARHTRQLMLARNTPLRSTARSGEESAAGHVALVSTGQPETLQAAAQRWLGLTARVRVTS